MYFNLIKNMFPVVRLLAGNITKSMSNRVTNNEISEKFT